MAHSSHSWRRNRGGTLLRRPEVERRTSLSRSRIYQLMAEDQFPQPVAIGTRAVAWDSAQVDSWVAERLELGAAERAARHPISPPQRRKANTNVCAGT